MDSREQLLQAFRVDPTGSYRSLERFQSAFAEIFVNAQGDNYVNPFVGPIRDVFRSFLRALHTPEGFHNLFHQATPEVIHEITDTPTTVIQNTVASITNVTNTPTTVVQNTVASLTDSSSQQVTAVPHISMEPVSPIREYVSESIVDIARNLLRISRANNEWQNNSLTRDSLYHFSPEDFTEFGGSTLAGPSRITFNTSERGDENYTDAQTEVGSDDSSSVASDSGYTTPPTSAESANFPTDLIGKGKGKQASIIDLDLISSYFSSICNTFVKAAESFANIAAPEIVSPSFNAVVELFISLGFLVPCLIVLGVITLLYPTKNNTNKPLYLLWSCLYWFVYLLCMTLMLLVMMGCIAVLYYINVQGYL
jgi:hypothetical protein